MSPYCGIREKHRLKIDIIVVLLSDITPANVSHINPELNKSTSFHHVQFAAVLFGKTGETL